MTRHLKNLYGCAIRLFYQLIYWALCYVPVFKLYQPVYGKDLSQEQLIRDCDDRWKVFSTHLPAQKGSFLDIGCNLGYFSFKAAEQGHFSYGIESEHFNITSCNAIKAVTNSKRAVFIKHLIDTEFLETMPAFDTVINLSVFHHWVKSYGADEAQNMMKLLAGKCQTLIFETGQSNEVGTKWAKKMDFMGDQPDQWIAGFLKDIGFSSVEVIGTFATGLTNVDRYLFVAKK